MAADSEAIDKLVASFKGDLGVLTPRDVVRRHIVFGSCVILEDSAYFGLRATVAEAYDIHPNDVLVVGSSKLGFSIAPSKRYRHFTDTSDIDVVVISRQLFRRVWKSVHRYWDQGGYWEKSAQFKTYLFRGWIRPDMLPSAESFAFANEWWEFFNSLSSSGKYSMFKISGALYESWYFLEAYQLRAVSSCIDELRADQQ